jgi:hypothetical protein
MFGEDNVRQQNESKKLLLTIPCASIISNLPIDQLSQQKRELQWRNIEKCQKPFFFPLISFFHIFSSYFFCLLAAIITNVCIFIALCSSFRFSFVSNDFFFSSILYFSYFVFSQEFLLHFTS